ncbi:MAG: ABC transporter permease [Ignisphaera sp.]|nr:ABC transporter permease [Ignisphaera sp.]MCX8167690.1 ABC transporter permease [Ignisphaera sp.]MDW8085680.1 ABC transporter permease [Ignisphaera sp.]
MRWSQKGSTVLNNLRMLIQLTNEWKLILLVIRKSPLTTAGLVIVSGFVILGIVGPYATLHDPIMISVTGALKRLHPPCLEHPFGTDEYGRDLFSRVLYGARVSLVAALSVMVIAVPIGVLLGLCSGYYGGIVDEVIMRITDIFLSFPGLVLAIALSASLGAGLTSAIIALAVVWWPGYVRVIRAQVLVVKEMLFVEAARAIGVKTSKILFRHILPNSITPLLVLITFDFGSVILANSALSFIGLGAQPPIPEWGRLIADGRRWFPDKWWYSFFPGLAILITVLGFNLLGDGIRDMMDPRYRRSIEMKG